MTYADATGVRTDTERDRRQTTTIRYRQLHRRALRCILHGDDQTADEYTDAARFLALSENDRGHRSLLIDDLERRL